MENNTSTIVSGPEKLLKESISQLFFGEEDVLSDNNEKVRRKIDLQRAQALGAQSKSNIKIYIEDQLNKKYVVEATVWAATEKNVTLKGGVLIPNKAIYKVGFF